MDCTPHHPIPARPRPAASSALAAAFVGCLLLCLQLCPLPTLAAAPPPTAPSASAPAAGIPADRVTTSATAAAETIGARLPGTAMPAGTSTAALTTNLPALGRTPTPLPDATFSLIRVFGALTLVLGLFLGGVWAVKNWHRFAAQRGQAQQLKILETRSLGGRHALYVVGYQGQRLLLAGSPTGVTLVSHLPSADAAEGAEATEAAATATPTPLISTPTPFPGARTPLTPRDDGRHFVQVLQQALQQKP